MGLDPEVTGALDAEVARIEARDRADSERDVAPLRQPEDAILIDTTELNFEAQVAAIVAAVEGHREGEGLI
jgi:cytidylate kinase